MTYFRRWRSAAAFGLVLTLASAAASAQSILEDEKGPEGEVSIELDVEALLLDTETLAASSSDGVWTIRPRGGKRMIQIPLIVRPVSGTAELSSANVKVGGGGFLCFRLDELPEGVDEDSEAAEQIMAERDGQPKFAKKFTVTEKGRIDYPMERIIFGGEVGGNELYALAIDRPKLNAQMPARPARGGNREEELRRFAEFQQKFADFRDLRERVGNLPKDFNVQMPRRVWAIFDMSVVKDELEIKLPDTEEEWTIDMRRLETLREQARTGKVDGNNARALVLVQAIGNLANDEHRWSQRLVAHTLASTHLAGEAKIGDILFIIFNQMLNSNDQQAYRVVVKELAGTLPPTRATVSLLKRAAERGFIDQQINVEVVINPIMKNLDDPGQIQEALLIANRLLADVNGPPPTDILTALIRGVDQHPQALPAIAKGVRFNNLDADELATRRRDAMIAVIELAGAEPLASGWLDTQFLGSVDNELIKETLTLIAESDTGSRSLGPFVKWMMEQSFGRTRNADGDEVVQRKAKLSAPLPIDSARHSIFRTLINNDPEVRKLAWTALPKFVMKSLNVQRTERDTRNRNGKQTVQVDPIMRKDLEDRYLRLRELALNQAVTPEEIVSFLIKQPNQDLATDALIEIVQRGTGNAPNSAANALRGSGGPIGVALLRQNFGERRGFAASMYSRLTNETPDVIGVLQQRADENPRALWFGNQIAAGNMPKTAEWIDAFENEEELLRLAGSHDPFLARGALAVLIAAAGGDVKELLNPTFETFEALGNRNMENLQTTWNQVRRDMYFDVVKGAVGTYAVRVEIYQRKKELAPDGTVAYADKPRATYDLGNVELGIKDDDVTIGSDKVLVKLLANANKPRIQIASAASLKDLQGENDNPLPLGGVKESIALEPTKAGVWRGSVTLDTSELAVVVFKPVTATEADAPAEARGGATPSDSATARRSN